MSRKSKQGASSGDETKKRKLKGVCVCVMGNCGREEKGVQKRACVWWEKGVRRRACV